VLHRFIGEARDNNLGDIPRKKPKQGMKTQ
jgi:hypothetical protein